MGPSLQSQSSKVRPPWIPYVILAYHPTYLSDFLYPANDMRVLELQVLERVAKLFSELSPHIFGTIELNGHF